MRLGITLVRFGLREMEDQVLAHTIRHTSCRDLTLRICDNWGNPESLTELWDRTCRDLIKTVDVICLLNSDCWVGPGWWEPIERAFSKDRSIAVLGPQGNSGPQTAPGQVPTPDLLAFGYPNVPWLVRASQVCRELWPGEVRDSEVFGHCYCVRAQVLASEADCFLPELVRGYTLYGSEQSLSKRLLARGFRVGTCMDSYAYHLGQASVKRGKEAGIVQPEIEKERGRALFEAT